MTDYPSIKPEDVRGGDVVRARFDAAQWPATIEGVVHYSLTDVEDYRLYVGGYVVSGATDLRLVSRPTPPEPPLRVGDFVRTEFGKESQITEADARNAPYWFHATTGWFMPEQLTRIEPPVGWPVGVPTEDGGTRWFARFYTTSGYAPLLSVESSPPLSWAGLLADGGVPALAVTK